MQNEILPAETVEIHVFKDILLTCTMTFILPLRAYNV